MDPAGIAGSQNPGVSGFCTVTFQESTEAMADKYDAVVVGGGPSGAVSARTLAAAGVKVFLVEKDLKRIKPCGGATSSKSFKEFNLPREGISKKIKSVSTISPAGFRIDVSLENGYVALLERGKFDHSLRKQAEEAGADLSEAEFLRIDRKQGKICITVTERGKERNIASDFLIAADGVNSRIAKATGLEPLPTVYTIQEEVDKQAAEDFYGLEACEFWFGFSHAPGFYSWVFPKEDYVDIGTVSTNGKLLKDLLKNFKKRRLINGEGRLKVYRLPVRQRSSMVNGNIIFVGDAAGLVMPLSYEGIYYAMKSGKMAAEAIIKGNPGDYERQWNKKFRKHFSFMEKLHKSFLKNDNTAELMVSLFKSKRVQDASMKLWFNKDFSLSSFFSYMNFFKKFLN